MRSDEEMDKGNYKLLNGYHVVFLVQSSFHGLGVLALPNSLSPMAYKQWLPIFLLGITASIALVFMLSLAQQYPKDSLFIIHQKLLGRFLGKIINIIMVFYCVLAIG